MDIQPPEQESAKKRAAISRIFPVKKPNNNSKGYSPGPVGGAGGKTGVKVEVKTEDNMMSSILKRLDGRPILMCRIPINALNRGPAHNLTPNRTPGGGKKRERKLSTASSTTSNSSKSSKKHKSKKENEVKPEATNLASLPGYSGAKKAEMLMPPPDRKLENDENLNQQAGPSLANSMDSDEFSVRVIR